MLDSVVGCRTYRYYNGSVGAPLVRFGQGLSYSKTALKCYTPGDGSNDVIPVNCSLTSVAGPDGDQILQVYHRVSADVAERIGSAHPIPLSTLVAFDRVALPAGSSALVNFALLVPRALSLVDATGASVLYPGLHYLDVWDGGMNNVTLAVQVPGPLTRVVAQPPLPGRK
jgi:Fibronectin type III-like domain